MPLAGAFYPDLPSALSSPVFPLTWIQCAQCGLIQVSEDIPDTLLFSDYHYASSSVAGLVRHFESYAELLTEKYSPHHPINFLEIGCNDGVLLRRLPPSWNLIGVDPSNVAQDGVSLSQQRYRLHNVPFSKSLMLDEQLENSIDVISGSNCLAHVSDPLEIFEAAYLGLRTGGHFWIEVHDLDALLRGHQWDTIYHEHKMEWSEDSLRRCLAPIGFAHVHTQRLPLHGGLLRMCFQKTELPLLISTKVISRDPRLIALRRAYESRHETPAAATLRNAQDAGQRIAAYGAAGRANVYLNQMSELHFEYVVDESPLRANSFLAKIGTPVVPLEVFMRLPPKHCLITAWNYREDIIRKNPNYSGDWLVAFEMD